MFLTCHSLKQHLLGPWLDSKNFPTYVKVKVRDIFESHTSWRNKWHPIDDTVVQPDTTWLFTWPKVCRDLMDFLEGAIYLPTSGEEYQYRQAVKNSTTCDELLAMKPWCDTIKTMQDGLRALANPDAVATDDQVTRSNPQDEDAGDSGAIDEHMSEGCKLAQASANLAASTRRLQKQQTAFLVEVGSYNGLKQLWENCPLSLVRASSESGNVLIQDLSCSYRVSFQKKCGQYKQSKHDKLRFLDKLVRSV